jgi:hypothetical protein
MAINRSNIRPNEVSPADESAHVLPENSELDTVMAIAKERSEYLLKMKEALLSGDDEQLKVYARKLCGLAPESSPRQPRAKLKK